MFDRDSFTPRAVRPHDPPRVFSGERPPQHLPESRVEDCLGSRCGVRKEAVHDKRSHPRVTLDADLVCVLPDGSEIQGRAKDISIGGLFVFTSSPVAFGTAVQVKLRLPPGRQEFVLPAVVRWTNPEGFGLQFGLLGARETHAISQLLRR